MAAIARVKIIEDRVCLSTAEMSTIMGVDKDTLTYWEKKGCPKAARGYWPLAEVLKWKGLVGTTGPSTEGEAGSKALNTQKLEAEVRYKNLQAETQELKNAISKGEYLERSEVVSEMTRCLMVLKRSLNGIARKLTTVVGPHVDTTTARLVDQELTEAMNDALEQLSVNGVYTAHGSRKKKA